MVLTKSPLMSVNQEKNCVDQGTPGKSYASKEKKSVLLLTVHNINLFIIKHNIFT